jgi:O-antigen/teichoic acid export membrane protein
MSLKRQVLWNMTPLMVVSALNIFSVPLFYRYLGTEMYALWFYVITFTGMFGFADLGLGVAVGRYMGMALGRGDHSAVREYWGTGNLVALPLLALMGVVFAGLGVAFGPRWFNVSPAHVNLLRGCFVAGGVALFLSYYGQFWNILLQAHLDFRFSSWLRIAMSLLGVIPAVAIASVTGNPAWIVAWGAITGVVQLALFVWYSRRHLYLGFELGSAKPARLREMASYIGKTFAALVIGAFAVSIDRLVLGRLAPAAAFTHYANCVNVGARLQGLGGAVMGPVFHNTSRAVGGDETKPAAIYNEMFDFTFGWYALASIWTAVWHPVLMRLWLGQEFGAEAAPLITPLVIAFCLTAIANISGSQLGALNRLGTTLTFIITTSFLTAAGVYMGWLLGGVVGVAYGFLGSRVAYLAQDLYTIRLVKAGGWLSAKTWTSFAAQALVGGLFALVYLLLPRTSFWLLLPAAAHAALVAVWLLRQPVRRFAAGLGVWHETPATAPERGVPGS